MFTEERLNQVMLRWQEIHKRGEPIDARQLCRDDPDLLNELKRRPELLDELKQRIKDRIRASRAADPLPRSAEEAKTTGELAIQSGAEPVPGYKLLHLLGRGGFGEVWKAHGLGGFPVAIKFIKLGKGTDHIELNSLQLMKDVRHPNLVPVFGAWEKGGYLVIAMELADQTLLDRLDQALANKEDGIPFPELIEYMGEAAKGIDYLNEQRHNLRGKERVSIQHRDIKPQNLFLVGGSVKVADFGLAKLLEQSIASHTGGMTPAYAAPEFLEGATTRQSDQYSLAVTYCHLRGGRLPFIGNHVQIMAGHLSRPPDLTMLPADERPAVAKALAKKPQERWHSCRAFVQGLIDKELAMAIAEGPPPDEVATSDEEEVPRIVRRKRSRFPSWPWLAGAAAGWLGMLTFFSLWLFTRPAAEPQGVAELPAGVIGEVRLLRGHAGCVTCVDVSPDGKYAISSSMDKTIRLWDIVKGEEIRTFGGDNGQAECAVFSHDGRQALSAGDDGIIRLWEVASGQEVRNFRAFVPSRNRALQDEPDPAVLLFSADNSQALALLNGKVSLWELETGTAKGSLQNKDRTINLAVVFNVKGRPCVLMFDGLLEQVVEKVTRMETRTEYKEERVGPVLKKVPVSITFPVEAERIRRIVRMTGDKGIRLVDVENGALLYKLTGPSIPMPEQPLPGVNQPPRPYVAPENAVFSADGRRLLLHCSDQFCRVVDGLTGEEESGLYFAGGLVQNCALSSEGRLALTRSSLHGGYRPFGGGFPAEQIRGPVKEAAEQAKVLPKKLEEPGQAAAPAAGVPPVPAAVAPAPAAPAAVWDSPAMTLTLWEVSTGRRLRSFGLEFGDVSCTALSANGRLALTGGQDGTIRVWALPDPASVPQPQLPQGFAPQAPAIGRPAEQIKVAPKAKD
jgi:serine/threonine protein kinase